MKNFPKPRTADGLAVPVVPPEDLHGFVRFDEHEKTEILTFAKLAPRLGFDVDAVAVNSDERIGQVVRKAIAAHYFAGLAAEKHAHYNDGLISATEYMNHMDTILGHVREKFGL